MQQALKPKVLMLHGWGQNEATFRQKSSALRKKLAAHCDFVYVSAPLPNNPADPMDEGRAWFDFPQEGTREERATMKEIEYKSLDPVMDFLARVLVEQGPFVGVLGFR